MAGLSPKGEVEAGRIDPVKPDMPDVFTRHPLDVNGTGRNPPAIGNRPFASDTRDPCGQNGKSGLFGQGVEKQMDGLALLDGNAFGRQVLKHIQDPITLSISARHPSNRRRR